MSTLSATSKGSGPYSKALKVSVVAAETAPKQYRGADGSQRSSLTACVSDGVVLARLVCYDSTHFPRLKVGSCLLLREIIRRKEDDLPLIVVTKNSKVFMCAPFEVPPKHKEQGFLILTPPPAELVNIAKALASPLKKRVSIAGKITQEDEPKKVNVRGDEVDLKTITVEDETGKSKLTLWRSAASSEVRPGDHVKVTDLVINVYNGITSLSTTGRTIVEKCLAPSITVVINVEAVGVLDGKAEMYTSEGESYMVSPELLMGAVNPDGQITDLESCTADGPVRLEITKQGSDVTTIKKV